MDVLDERLDGRPDGRLDGAARRAHLRSRVALAHVAPFRLGDVLVDPSRREVIGVDGRGEMLEPRAMQVLVALHRADGQVLGRDDLIASCWGGTHVGEDAPQRAVALLRRVAAGMGEGAFVIETLPRIGYRLVTDGASRSGLGSETLPKPPQSGDGAPPANAIAAAAPRRGSPGTALLFLVALAVVLAGWWIVARPSSAPEATLQLVPVRTGAGVPPAAAAAFDFNLRNALAGASAVTVRDGHADYRLVGRVDAGPPRRYTATLLTRDGTLVWSVDRAPPAGAQGDVRLAATIAKVVRCGLGGLATYRGTLAPRVGALYLNLCEGGAYRRQIDAATRLTAHAPDFAAGWGKLASANYEASYLASPGEAPAFRRAALAAAARALALDPAVGAAYRVQGLLLPPTAPLAERERLLRRSIEGFSDCACEHEFYRSFLAATGRIGAAMGEAQRAADMDPGAASVSITTARLFYLSGNPAQAVAVLAPLQDRTGGTGDIARIDGALHARDWAAAARIQARQTKDADGRAMSDVYAALASGDHGAIDAAAAIAERLARAQANGEYQQHYVFMSDQPGLVLAAMGRPQGAFDAIAAMIRTNGTEGMEMLFDPVMAPWRDDPRYMALLRSSGLMTYWRTTRTRPDYCNVRNRPGWCGALG